ncbi:MAG: biopolymer transporter ExbD [Rhodobacteraceae bacterium]|nr:MAG: biopolymer transporter ExbD [Paracoccaceae bacterium]
MDFSPPPRKPSRESVVPMINVVFLLLIFFLMSAQIAPTDPVELTPPVLTRTNAPLPEAARVAWLGADGVLIHDELQGAEALAALAMAPGPLILRADAALAAEMFAATLRDLAQAGITEVTLAAITGAE